VEKAILFASKEYQLHFLEDCGIWMIDRSTWQRELAKSAQQIGVSIKEDFPIAKNHVLEMLDTYEYIIDASGALSVTSGIYGFAPLYIRTAALSVQYVIQGDFDFFR